MIIQAMPYPAAGGGGAWSGWLPSSLTGLQAWYDADDLSGADGSNMTTGWPDRSGNAFHATPATAAYPKLRTNFLNARKAVEFASGNGNILWYSAQLTMSSSLMNGATAGSYFAVCKTYADPPFHGGSPIDAFTNDTGGSRASHVPYSDGNVYEHFGMASRFTVGNPTPSFSSARIYNANAQASGLLVFLDATQIYNSGAATVNFGNKTRQLGFSTGGAGNDYWMGHLCEILIYNSVLSQANREKVEGYLAHKWGLTANLPSGHPYKTTPPT